MNSITQAIIKEGENSVKYNEVINNYTAYDTPKLNLLQSLSDKINIHKYKDKLIPFKEYINKFIQDYNNKYNSIKDLSTKEFFNFIKLPVILFIGYNLCAYYEDLYKYYNDHIKNIQSDIDLVISECDLEELNKKKAEYEANEANETNEIVKNPTLTEISTDCAIVPENSKAIDFKEINYTTDDNYKDFIRLG
jgi:hypothetical protein